MLLKKLLHSTMVHDSVAHSLLLMESLMGNIGTSVVLGRGFVRFYKNKWAPRALPVRNAMAFLNQENILGRS
jgi:hypothetical protein